MENLSQLIQSNIIIVQVSVGLIVFLFLLKLFTNGLIIFLITSVIAYNLAFFTIFNDNTRVNHKIKIQKALDYNNQFIFKGDILKNLSNDTQTLLNNYNIKSKEDLEKFLLENLDKSKLNIKNNKIDATIDEKLNFVEVIETKVENKVEEIVEKTVDKEN